MGSHAISFIRWRTLSSQWKDAAPVLKIANLDQFIQLDAAPGLQVNGQLHAPAPLCCGEERQT